MKQIEKIKNGMIWIGNDVSITYRDGKLKDIFVYAVHEFNLHYGKYSRPKLVNFSKD